MPWKSMPTSRQPPFSGNSHAVDTRGKLRCSVGGEWKPRHEFSSTQLGKFDRSRALPSNPGIACRVHTTQPARELQCEGPCSLWRPLEHFSKNSKASGKYWCIDCTTWQLSVEPGMVPCPPPNSILEVDELALLHSSEPKDEAIEENRADRVEKWIQDNPSEMADYFGVENTTQPSVVDSVSEVSEVSEPTLMDDVSGITLAGLPQPLSVTNLGRVGRYDESAKARTRPSNSYGFSSRSDKTASMSTDTRSESSDSKATVVAGSIGDTEPQTLYATSHSGSDAGDVVLAHNELTYPMSALTGPPERVRSPGASGWARPDQRKISWAPPRYVLGGSGPDFFEFYSLQQSAHDTGTQRDSV